MSLELQRPELTELKPRITVIGVGGAGGNAVANMISSGLEGVDFVVANTDAQALSAATAETRLQLGLKITQGLGAGSRPEIGRAAAEETLSEIEGALDGSHMCFITAGMGGGTGTGAAPVVAKAARERGILTVGVVTKPFAFEGARRMRSAEEGIAELQKHVDTLIIIPNQNLFLIANANTTFKDAFAMADQVLHQGVRGITDLMIMPGLINLDFADIRTVMSEMGKAMMGTGEAEGENRAIEAAEKAIANPLLDEVSMRGAKGVIINITGGEDLRLMEVDEAANHIREMVDPDANIIVGSAFNANLDGKMRVSVVATGIDMATKSAEQLARTSNSVSGFGAVAGSFAPAGPAIRPAVAAPAPTTQPEEAQITLEPPVMAEEPAVAEAALIEDAQPGFSDNVMPLRMPEPQAQPVREAEPEPVAAAPAPINEPVERPYVAPRQTREDPRPGPTLFERMMNLSRGADKARADEPAPAPEEPAGQDPLEIPRFFRRQVND
ncbi:cell division protein FtsZ [Sphingosinicella soli]|uniref:Cell division protein FtsZ n=1 Tax=Sphingosinicella soli TaxID=333708 RepID=A0A7W7B0M3_9SPHN|nr:cell division protein FtsZ [Sphingosinicella soli]MBB4631831.1 cell division protein FtsZ [Sphingosinicella soli]